MLPSPQLRNVPVLRLLSWEDRRFTGRVYDWVRKSECVFCWTGPSGSLRLLLSRTSLRDSRGDLTRTSRHLDLRLTFPWGESLYDWRVTDGGIESVNINLERESRTDNDSVNRVCITVCEDNRQISLCTWVVTDKLSPLRLYRTPSPLWESSLNLDVINDSFMRIKPLNLFKTQKLEIDFRHPSSLQSWGRGGVGSGVRR